MTPDEDARAAAAVSETQRLAMVIARSIPSKTDIMIASLALATALGAMIRHGVGDKTRAASLEVVIGVVRDVATMPDDNKAMH
jgi:hypothetical protein